MEATGCRLAMTGHGTLVIVSVYLPSPKKLLRRNLRNFLTPGNAVILFGYFNYKAPGGVVQLLIIMKTNSLNSRTDSNLKLSRPLRRPTILTSQQINSPH
ncbi:hypothetical protein EVAR_85285_1 [Eumeta japonica]|uniref:Uncharacterized protein n=1 Tax=Eumeta variegata TaxID=151549 RepID=A0A4C1VA77_EUMVA|nr:hypothetical protein EVAR_85285_1 [Eumeta japonica]